MREIKFRGKDCQNEWVYGDLIHKRNDPDDVMIQDSRGLGSDCDPETVGQFTGLYDKNGKEIYEGDILKHVSGQVKKDGHFVDNADYITVKFKDAAFNLATYALVTHHLEVIGNIHDNSF